MQCYNIDKNIEPFHLFLTVGSGVGKSHAIKFIYNIAHSVLEPRREDHLITKVLLTAPTELQLKALEDIPSMLHLKGERTIQVLLGHF